MRYYFLLAALLPIQVYAQTLIKSPTPGAGQNLCEFIELLFTIISWVAFPGIGIMIVNFGFKMVMANGDMKVIAANRKGLIWALVGLAVILSAKTILAIAIDMGQSVSDGGPLESACPLG